MNPLDALRASGLNPILVDENTDFDEVFKDLIMPKKVETNVQFIERIMTQGCPTGALIQPFIIEALRRYAEAYAETPIPENDLLSPEAWTKTAQWLKSELEKKYG